MLHSDEIKPMLTVKDVALLLHIHVNTARRWSDQGIIKSYRITRRGDRRFRREDILHYLAEFNESGIEELAQKENSAAFK
jgi:excisionase family DNA binding protein